MKIKPFKIQVDLNFPIWAMRCEGKYNFSKARNAGGDALLLEYYLLENNLVDKPTCWRHDFIWNGRKIDAKEINSEYFNIHRKNDKVNQYREFIVMKELSHFLFYRTNRPKEEKLMIGDVVEIEILGLCDARKIMKNIIPSHHDDTTHFVALETIRILDELGDINEPIMRDLTGMYRTAEEKSRRLSE